MVRVVTPSRLGELAAGPVTARLQQGQQAEQPRRRVSSIASTLCRQSTERSFPLLFLAFLVIHQGPTGPQTRRSSDERRASSPFRIEIPQADVDDLHARLAAARWPGRAARRRPDPRHPARATCASWPTTGAPAYDWRAQEAQLNAYPQFTTEIDGQRIHFMHVRSGQPDAMPLLITHGFPSSVAEFTAAHRAAGHPAERAGVPRRRPVPARGTRSRRRWARPAGRWAAPLGRGSS